MTVGRNSAINGACWCHDACGRSKCINNGCLFSGNTCDMEFLESCKTVLFQDLVSFSICLAAGEFQVHKQRFFPWVCDPNDSTHCVDADHCQGCRMGKHWCRCHGHNGSRDCDKTQECCAPRTSQCSLPSHGGSGTCWDFLIEQVVPCAFEWHPFSVVYDSCLDDHQARGGWCGEPRSSYHEEGIDYGWYEWPDSQCAHESNNYCRYCRGVEYWQRQPLGFQCPQGTPGDH
jgi:hypothetical protein